jgi:hypothetical protein
VCRVPAVANGLAYFYVLGKIVLSFLISMYSLKGEFMVYGIIRVL